MCPGFCRKLQGTAKQPVRLAALRRSPETEMHEQGSLWEVTLKVVRGLGEQRGARDSVE